MKKGNILTIYSLDPQDLENIEQYLSTYPNLEFIRLVNTFYIRMLSAAGPKLVKDIHDTFNLRFSFVHISIFNGSVFVAPGLDPQMQKRINEILS